jgi:hypothetical protein
VSRKPNHALKMLSHREHIETDNFIGIPSVFGEGREIAR